MNILINHHHLPAIEANRIHLQTIIGWKHCRKHKTTSNISFTKNHKQEKCVEDWPEDSPELNPDFKPVRKNSTENLLSSPYKDMLPQTLSIVLQCETNDLWRLFLSFFFYKSGKLRLRRESLKVRYDAFLWLVIVLFVAKKQTKKIKISFLEEDGFGWRKWWRSRRRWRSQQGTASRQSATAQHSLLQVLAKDLSFHSQKKDKKFRMSLLSRRGSKVNKAMRNNRFAAVLVFAISSAVKVICLNFLG